MKLGDNLFRTESAVFIFVLLVAFFLSFGNAAVPCSEGDFDQEQEKAHLERYEPTWESLTQHPVPEWFMDSKFGIYAHFGLYCVPAFGSEWYPRNMYREKSNVHKHHLTTYGDPAVFGYKDFIPLFKAAKFDAEEWAELYKKAGARFAGPVAEHHDGFSMWDSDVNRWNAADMGPGQDIAGDLIAALRKRGLKIITSFHHAFNFQGYFTAKEGWDTADPEFYDLYGQFKNPEMAHERWLLKIKEVIDKYRPDQIWFDFGLRNIPDEYKQRMAAYYYNKEPAWNKPVIITRKGEHLPEGVGVLDIERGKMEGMAGFLWQTDDSTAVNSWCWTSGLVVKPAAELVHELIDIVSKNGVLLLNVCPKGDGSIPGDQKALLLEMGQWLETNGEAIYGTRCWNMHGEGPNLLDEGRGFHREAVPFTGRDIRYTRSKDGHTLYAIALGWPEKPFALEMTRVEASGKEAGISLLGHEMPLQFHVNTKDNLVIEPPELAETARPCSYAYAFKIMGFDLSVHPDAIFHSGDAITLEAAKATLEGDKIGLETKGEMESNIGFWDNPKERVHWLARVRRAGEYLVRGDFAIEGNAGNKVALEAAGQTLLASITETGGWDKVQTVKMGKIRFDAPGVYHIVLRPADVENWKAVNVWRIQLARIP